MKSTRWDMQERFTVEDEMLSDLPDVDWDKSSQQCGESLYQMTGINKTRLSIDDNMTSQSRVSEWVSE